MTTMRNQLFKKNKKHKQHKMWSVAQGIVGMSIYVFSL